MKTSIKEILHPNASFEDKFISDLERLKGVVKALQQFGYKVVLTQGVYDLYHKNHGKYLRKAKEQGDVLIVGVDSDEMTRERKGKNRPIDPEMDRLEGLSYLGSVNILTLRTLQDAAGDIDYLCKALRPDVFVMSRSTRDFPEEKKYEFEKNYVGRVEVLEPQGETSTSSRIRTMMIDGAGELQERVMKTMSTYFDELKGVNS